MFQKNNSSNEINTIIGKNSYFKGVFSLKGALRVEGCYEGENLSVDSIFVTTSGKVKSNIKASTVVAEGIIIGNIEAKNRVMLMPTSRILGEIRTPELIIQNGAILEGLCVIAPSTTINPKEGIFALYNNNTDGNTSANTSNTNNTNNANTGNTNTNINNANTGNTNTNINNANNNSVVKK